MDRKESLNSAQQHTIRQEVERFGTSDQTIYKYRWLSKGPSRKSIFVIVSYLLFSIYLGLVGWMLYSGSSAEQNLGRLKIDTFVPVWNVGIMHEQPIGSLENIRNLLSKTPLESVSFMHVLFSIAGVPIDKRLHSLGDFFSFPRFRDVYSDPSEIVFRKRINRGCVAHINFYHADNEARQILLASQTRIHCSSIASRAKFYAYWPLIMPFSSFLRQEILNAMANMSESSL